jgi:hypothetical protein
MVERDHDVGYGYSYIYQPPSGCTGSAPRYSAAPKPVWPLRGRLFTVERVARVFTAFAEADQADEQYYATLDPSERVDIVLELIERYRSSLGETAERFERVYRVTELAKG